MLSDFISLAIFDMAGTTVRDQKEVENCFYEAAVQSELPASRQRINDMQGLPKKIVVQTLWGEAIGPDHPELPARVENTYALFCDILENHYRTAEVAPAPGAPETLRQLREEGVKIALTTGFYRKVTNIILQRLGWDADLDETYMAVGPKAVVDLSLTPDETERGRPYPDMIQAAMRRLGVADPQRVVNLGDTPSDLLSGQAAGVGLSLGVSNGTHSREALLAYPHHHLLANTGELVPYLRRHFQLA